MEKHKGLAIILVIAIVILGFGFVAFQTFSNLAIGPHSSVAMNTTAVSGNTIFNIAGIIVVVGAIMTIVGLAYYYVSTPERYKKPSKLISFLDTTTYYFGWGLLSFVIFAIPGYLMYLLWQYTVTEGNTGSFIEVMKWIAIIVVAYFLLAGLGYLIKKKIVDNWRARRQEKHQEEYKDNMKELPTGGN
jgi:hypothetical protein